MSLRVPLTIAAAALLTFALLPVQAAAVAFRRPLRRRIPVLYHRAICALLGVRVHVVGAPLAGQPVLIVANHVSWLDVSAITSVAAVVFVAKSEIASWPLFGVLAKLQRSVFVERARRHKTAAVNAEIVSRLAEGDPVVLFGEGTSSDGNRVLPFRSALIGAARDALAQAEAGQQVFLQPLSLAYAALHGMPMGRQHRPLAAWYGDVDLIPHLLEIVRRGRLDIVLTWGEPVGYGPQTDRKEIARTLQAAVRRLTSGALRGPGAAAMTGAGPGIPFSPGGR